MRAAENLEKEKLIIVRFPSCPSPPFCSDLITSRLTG
jgi:hypothetical protein